MIAKFAIENNGLEFMGFLREQNNQGHKQILFGWAGDGHNVEYSFNDVIHDDVKAKVADKLILIKRKEKDAKSN